MKDVHATEETLSRCTYSIEISLSPGQGVNVYCGVMRVRQLVGVARLDKGVLRRNHHPTADELGESLGKKGGSMYHLTDGLQQAWHTRGRETIPGK